MMPGTHCAIPVIRSSNWEEYPRRLSKKEQTATLDVGATAFELAGIIVEKGHWNVSETGLAIRSFPQANAADSRMFRKFKR